jgi:tetratricopeptide (TPR) repeat protein
MRSLLEEDPDQAQERYNWMKFCDRIADHLEADGHRQRLPDLTFNDSLNLDLGGLTLQIHDFGPGRHSNSLMVMFPEERLLLASAFSPHHLAPIPATWPQPEEIEKWLGVLDRILEGDHEIETVACGFTGTWKVQELVQRRDYMRDLWESVSAATADGLDFETARQQLSLNSHFSYVQDWAIWTEDGEPWVRQDHGFHLESFWRARHESASEAIEQSLSEGGVEAAARKFSAILADPQHRYFFSESELNGLGYRLLGEKRLADAIAVFEMNVKAFPNSGNVYDSLGEAQLVAGQDELAIQNYRKSLEINPQNDNARKVLAELEP